MTALLLAARASLKRRGVTETLRHLTNGNGAPARLSPRDALRALRLPGALLRAACLEQSVALTAVLARAHKEPTLVLGARHHDNRPWGAHAWVVVGEEVLDPVPSGRHEAFAKLDATTGWVPAPVG
jgi:hypothetical protein